MATWFDIHVADDQSSSDLPDENVPPHSNDAGGTTETGGTPQDSTNGPISGSDQDATQPIPGSDADADATAPIPTDTDDADTDATADADVTAPLATDADATELTPAVDPYATEAISPDDEVPTHVIRPPTPDPTEILAPATWRGAAGVRADQPGSDATSAWTAPPPSGRAWWLPALLGVVGLIVLIGVTFALLYALRSGSSPAPAPVPAPSVSQTPATPSPVLSTAPATPQSASPSGPASPATPSASAPPSAPPSVGPSGSSVVIPSTLTGLLFPDVQAELSSLGLHYRLQPRADPSVLANTVLATDPGAGTSVPPGSVITIVYAITPASPSAPAS